MQKRAIWVCLTVFMLISMGALPVFAQDLDGDGHVSVRNGGDDCDDRDPNRYPGNVEICDAAHHDEDCNPETYGHRDQDGDGEVDVKCCNRSGGKLFCGTDCDDNNRAIQPASQVCDGRRVAICQENGNYSRKACPGGTSCVQQPNGTGVCMVPPPGYTPPLRFAPMSTSARQTRPANERTSTTKKLMNK